MPVASESSTREQCSETSEQCQCAATGRHQRRRFATENVLHFAERQTTPVCIDATVLTRSLQKLDCTRNRLHISSGRSTARLQCDRRRGPKRPFPRRYTKADIGLLAAVDETPGRSVRRGDPADDAAPVRGVRGCAVRASGRAFCEWIRSIRATWTGRRVCTRSISWTRSRSTSSWPPRRAPLSVSWFPALPLPRRDDRRRETQAEDLLLRQRHHALPQAEVARWRRPHPAARRQLRAARPAGPGTRRSRLM